MKGSRVGLYNTSTNVNLHSDHQKRHEREMGFGRTGDSSSVVLTMSLVKLGIQLQMKSNTID